jgi:hypothetical protein
MWLLVGVAALFAVLFTDRFSVTPEEALTQIPESLRHAHPAREVSPWTVRDGRLVTICRH